jgi:hypothetical protein
MSFLTTHELALTWAALGAGLVLIVVNIWRETRPRTSLDVSIWPTTPFRACRGLRVHPRHGSPVHAVRHRQAAALTPAFCKNE